MFAVDLHETGPSGGDVHWRGAATGESRASFEGLIQIDPGAQQTHTYLQFHSMMLSPTARTRRDPLGAGVAPTTSRPRTAAPSASSTRTLIFYMQTRGPDRAAGRAGDRRGLLRAADRRARRTSRSRSWCASGSPPSSRAAREDIEALRASAMTLTSAALGALDVRADFPILARELGGRPLVYLDSAATSQKPAGRDRRRSTTTTRAQRQRPPRRLRAGPGGRRGLRGRARADRRVHRTGRPRRRSSPRT